MKKTRKLTVLVAALLATILMFSGCGAATIQKQQVEEGKTAIELTGECTAILEGESIRVTLKSNLKSGAQVRFSVNSHTGEQLATQDMTQDEKGEIVCSLDIDPAWKDEGVIYIGATCDPSKYAEQPQDVRDAYGSRFQNITGENVIFDASGNIFAVQAEKIDLSK